MHQVAALAMLVVVSAGMSGSALAGPCHGVWENLLNFARSSDLRFALLTQWHLSDRLRELDSLAEPERECGRQKAGMLMRQMEDRYRGQLEAAEADWPPLLFGRLFDMYRLACEPPVRISGDQRSTEDC